MNGETSYLATCARGTADVIGRQLSQLGARAVEPGGGAVRFRGRLETALRACIELRSAHRVLWEIAAFAAPDAAALYEGTAAIDWSAHLTPESTLAVEGHGGNERLTDRRFIALKVKDAVVDRLRARYGARPDVDPRDPAVRIVVHVAGTEARLSLDLSGESLHRRGYRTRPGEAPLRETLAAAVLALGEFEGERPMLDPMCGSGTLPIEAALIARRRPPGLDRSFGIERWPSFTAEQRRLLEELRAAARAGARDRAPHPILAGDVDPRALAAARDNARRAGVESAIRFIQADLRDLVVREPTSLLAVNPPYGRRARSRADSVDGLYRLLGRKIAEMLGSRRDNSVVAGCVPSGRPSDAAATSRPGREVVALCGGRALVLMADRGLIQTLGLEPTWCRNLMNGPVPVVLARFG